MKIQHNQNLQATPKAVDRYTYVTKYIKYMYYKRGNSQINNLSSHLKHLEKDQQNIPTVNRKKTVIKIKARINAIEKRKTIKLTLKRASQFFEKINKMD